TPAPARRENLVARRAHHGAPGNHAQNELAPRDPALSALARLGSFHLRHGSLSGLRGFPAFRIVPGWLGSACGNCATTVSGFALPRLQESRRRFMGKFAALATILAPFSLPLQSPPPRAIPARRFHLSPLFLFPPGWTKLNASWLSQALLRPSRHAR